MRAAVYHAPGRVELDEVADPVLVDPTDAIVRIEAAGVCGSDLWTYRGQSSAAPGSRIGHEFVGTVVEVGAQVRDIAVGRWVIAPFRFSDGTCAFCRAGLPSSCLHGGFWGRDTTDAGQGEYARVPFADGTLVPVAGGAPDAALVPSLLTLTDVMGTGYHAALRGGVGPGSTTVVVGDGAVGLCAVVAARHLGAERVIVLASSHADRRHMAERLGATDLVTTRGPEAVAQVRELTGGLGPDQVLECVGTAQSFDTALGAVRPGGVVSYVGLPHGVNVELAKLFGTNVTITGGIAPVRAYVPELLPLVLDAVIDPGQVFTSRLALADVATAYHLMDSRQTIKTLLTPAA